MLKKVIVGILCLVILAFTGVGIYVYTLDWNKHRTTVSQRLSQITGLNAVIDGNLKIEFFPTPKVTAGQVKFYKSAARVDPLIMINEINADVEFMPLLDNKFVITSMILNEAMVNIVVNEKGEMNWANVKNQGINKSGNVEASFSNVKLNKSTINYENVKDKKEFKIPNISASVSAPSLAGPYNTNGQFIHNGAEIKFSGNIVNEDKTKVNMVISNSSTSSKINIEGTIGDASEGIFTLDTGNLYGLSSIVFGKDSINPVYNLPTYFSFKYKNSNDIYTLDNFTAKYGNNTVGTGKVVIQPAKEKKLVTADFDMKKFDLDIIKNICDNYVDFIKKGGKFSALPYTGELSIKATDVLLNNIDAQDLSFLVSVDDEFASIERFGLSLLGDSTVKMVGKINLDTLQYVFAQSVKTADLRVLASIFDIDLAKLANAENKKSIFHDAHADMEISGDLNNLKISVKNAEVDTIKFNGDIGYVIGENKNLLLLDINTSKIIFDRYVDVLPKDLENSSMKDKFIYQLKLIPYTDKVDIDANIKMESAVYNEIPLEKVALQFLLNDNNLDVKKLDIENIAGANLSLLLNATDVFGNPYFNNLSYTLKSSDFPLFAATLGIKTGTKLLFNSKLLVSQGILKGLFDDYELSLLQKFGNTEFSYNGSVKKNNENTLTVDGDLELKTNNFATFVKSIGLNYNPNIALTSFTISGKLKGVKDNFELSNINAFLGANNITGMFNIDTTKNKPMIVADLVLNSFEANRWFDIDTKFANYTNNKDVDFIKKALFIDDKIDYSKLNNLDFDIKAKAKKVYYYNDIYSDVSIATNLMDRKLTVSSFNANNNNTDINMDFVLDSNDLPKISGNYDLKNIELPDIGGKLYSIGKSSLDAKGSFDSLASSKKEFFDKLSAKGNFKLSNTTIKGLDLDVIKFELEQRKTIEGLKNKIENSLKSGKSNFNLISGNYDIHKGVVIAEDIVLESPVANMNMDLNFNLNDWLFSANFDILYHNASFYDAVKFTLNGNLENPNISINIDDSIKRIGDAENRVKKAFADEEKEKRQRISNKLSNLNTNIDKALASISRISLDVVRYTPVSSNEDVKNTFDSNVKILHDTENSIKNMALSLSKNPSEESLMNIDAEFWSEEAKLKFISKTLEDNFIVDSKYVFDDIFNKIIWIYNVAQNNTAYYNTVSDAYIALAKKLDDTSVVDKLLKSKNNVEADMSKIDNLQEKIRDNYLHIIDSSKVSEMNSNIEVAKQALQTILTYTKQLNEDIVSSIDLFRSELNINERNYDEFLVYPPEFIDDINIKDPTYKSKEDPLKGILTPTVPQDNAVMNKVSFGFDTIKNGLGGLLNKFNADNLAQKESKLVSKMAFNGLSDILKKGSEASQELDLEINIADINSNIDFTDNEISSNSDIIEAITATEAKIEALETKDSIDNDSMGVQIDNTAPIEIADKTPVNKDVSENVELVDEPKNDTVVAEAQDKTLQAPIISVNRDEIPNIVRDLNISNGEIFIADTKPTNTVQDYYNKLDDANYTTKSLITALDKSTALNLAEENNSKNNRYVFAVDKNMTSIKAYGSIGKSMLKEKVVETKDRPKQNRYLFASNDNFLPFSGSISKFSKLAVK